MMYANRQGRCSMTEQMRRLIETFTKVGVTGPAIVQEIARFRVLDQIIAQSGKVRGWGITPKELFELAQTSTVDMFGPLPYDEAGFKDIYGISFSVELMDFISATGYYEGVSAGRQWTVPMQEVIDFHKNTEGIILFAYFEEYAAIAEEVMQTLPTDRLLFYTPSESCYDLFRSLYPLAPVINEWPEDVIFDHIVAATSGMFTAPVTTMEEMAARVNNVSEKGTVRYFIPVSAVQDQLNMNRVALQFMILQNHLEVVREWAPLQTYEFRYGLGPVKKVDLSICEIVGDGYKQTNFIPLPHEILASMETFSLAHYGLSLYGVQVSMNPKHPTMGEDGYMHGDYRIPTYMQRMFEALEGYYLQVSMKGIDVSVTLEHKAGIPLGASPEDTSVQEAMEQSILQDDTVEYRWYFNHPSAPFLWYTYFNSEEGKQVVRTLASMVTTTPALLQLMGSCRRQVVKEEALATFTTSFKTSLEQYEIEKGQAETNWVQALATLANEIVPVPTEVKPEVEED